MQPQSPKRADSGTAPQRRRCGEKDRGGGGGEGETEPASPNRDSQEMVTDPRRNQDPKKDWFTEFVFCAMT